MNEKHFCLELKFYIFPRYGWLFKGGFDNLTHPIMRLAMGLRQLPVFDNRRGAFNKAHVARVVSSRVTSIASLARDTVKLGVQ